MADLRANQLQSKDYWILIALTVIIPIAGELNFHPFDNVFRVSFGTPIFFFSLLYYRKISPVVMGLLVGISVSAFRILLDWMVSADFSLVESITLRYPTFFYYFTFAFLFYLMRVNRFQHPLLIGCFGITIEIVSSLVELMLYHLFVLGTTVTMGALNKIIIIAVFRSFFVLAFINMMKLYELRLKESQTRRENENMLKHLSNLYVESVYLKKTLQNAETITKESYTLYRNMNDFIHIQGPPIKDWGKKALRIAGEVHEIKKDNQRIFAGLTKLISSESLPEYMNVHELAHMIVRINQKYAALLGKKIEFVSQIKGQHPNYHIYLMLSFINNLVANAVEAIENTGTITVSIEKEDNWIDCKVIDDGPGVPSKYKQLIFKPGFTSKYRGDGTPSTGMGLSYIKEMAEELGGEVKLLPRENGCIFTVRLPILSLAEEG
ncbi:sensor histidine kinase [Neobacillus pocheonensis]|uniref:histidine kinase n=1 Tax=Neobacillus pocheonensis TaxID=363869 RepID=A0ABT0WF57_9BACI|nr:sensor histidine kinase [Neobacillus pocheonensis]